MSTIKKAVKQLIYDASSSNEPADTSVDDFSSHLVDQLGLTCQYWSVASSVPQFELFNRITSHEILGSALKDVYLDFDELATVDLDGYCSELCEKHGQRIKEGLTLDWQNSWSDPTWIDQPQLVCCYSSICNVPLKSLNDLS